MALKEIEQVIKRPHAFDPKTANRTFVMAAGDSSTVILGVGFIDRIRKVAGPDLRMAFRTPSPELIADQLERGEVDLLWAPNALSRKTYQAACCSMITI